MTKIAYLNRLDQAIIPKLEKLGYVVKISNFVEKDNVLIIDSNLINNLPKLII